MSAPVFLCLFFRPSGRMVKVHAEPCMYAPGVLLSNGPRWPRPGPQAPARRCEHAASGCGYPEGECAGLCLAQRPA